MPALEFWAVEQGGLAVPTRTHTTQPRNGNIGRTALHLAVCARYHAVARVRYGHKAVRDGGDLHARIFAWQRALDGLNLGTAASSLVFHLL